MAISQIPEQFCSRVRQNAGPDAHENPRSGERGYKSTVQQFMKRSSRLGRRSTSAGVFQPRHTPVLDSILPYLTTYAINSYEPGFPFLASFLHNMIWPAIFDGLGHNPACEMDANGGLGDP